MRSLTLFFLLVLFSVAASPVWAKTTEKAKPVTVVASFSILADMVQQIGGKDVTVFALIKAGQEPHGYRPSAQDSIKIQKADLVIINGLELEGWMDKLIKSSHSKAKIVVATEGLRPRFVAPLHRHDHEETLAERDEHPDKLIPDPHAWMDLHNAPIYIKNIVEGLSAARPDLAATFEKRGQDYEAQCLELDRKTREQLTQIPYEQRKVITQHLSFGYFASSYSVQFFAPLGINAETEASAQDVAHLIDQIKREKISAVFLENLTNSKLIKQIAKETGIHVTGTLYPESLTPTKGPAPTYLKMMEHNVRAIVESLGMNEKDRVL